MDDARFDDLIRVFAQNRSRRGVLRVIGASALGGLGLARLSDRAAADNSDCAHWCHDRFAGAEADACTSDAAHGTGLCYQCGPAAPAGNGLQFCGGACIPLCTALDQCHAAGVCDPSTRACTNPAQPDGTACDDGNACTFFAFCDGGVCVGGGSLLCTSSDPCQLDGTCDPATGQCTFPAAPDGTACDDGDPATCGDVCTGGTCAGTATDLQTDDANCGACGHVCGANQHCSAGACANVK
jgi:hypothetical protein